MSIIWGNTAPEMNDGETTCVFEHAVIEPNFLQSAEIMHESALTGHRSWSKQQSFVEFTVMDFLCDYNNPSEKALEILGFEDKEVTFILATDGDIIIQARVESIDFFPLNKPWKDELAVIVFKGIDKTVFSPGYILDDITGLPVLDDDGNPMIADGIVLHN